MNQHPHIEIPSVPIGRITAEVIAKTDLMLTLIATENNIRKMEEQYAKLLNLSSGSLRKYKKELRRIFSVPDRTSIAHLADHPQIRQAIEVLLTRNERSDKLSLRGAKNLNVIVEKTGEVISLQAHLEACYPNEGTSQTDVYITLLGLVKAKRIVTDNGETATREQLPAEVSVARFLRAWKKKYVSVRKGQSRENDWNKNERTYITRNVELVRAGEIWIADHTELDFMVINENGKHDRRWITTFIDMRTRLLVGYHLSWQPNSNTIALAFRNGVMGSQLRAATQIGDDVQYREMHINTVPETVMMDNGKDYRSKYTQGAFGKIDFTDTARVSVQRICKLHYTKKYHGQSKAQMERWFRTIQEMIKHLPGYKGNRYENKPDSLKQDLKTGNILPVQIFDELVVWAINAYNNRIHGSLKDQSPLQYYLSNATLNRSIDTRVLDFLLVRIQRNNGTQPKINRGQVIANGKEYFSESLVQYNNSYCDVYYDPNDPGFVSVYVNGEFAAIAVNKAASLESNGWQQQLVQQTRSEKAMMEELKKFRAPYSKGDVKEMILLGRMTNVTPVSAELMQKEIPTMTVFTGIEEAAKQNQKEMATQKQVIEIEQSAKRRGKNLKPLTEDLIANIQ